MVIEAERLGATLSLVIAGPRTRAADRTSIVLTLRVPLRVTVDLTGRCEQQPRPMARGDPQHIERSNYVGDYRLDGVSLVVHGARGTREMEDPVRPHVTGHRDITQHEAKI